MTYALLVVFCFFAFNHADVTHTIGCTFAAYEGHIADFYDFNAVVFQQLNYLPSTYLIYAIWGLPLKLFGLTAPNSMPSLGIILWYKVLTTLIFIASAVVLSKIVRKVTDAGLIPLRAATWIWVSSPIVLFSQFIFAQYDIFTVFLTLLGTYFWMDRKLWQFSLIFGFAITFKYFPLFAFLPLLLLVEKRPARLIGYCLLFAIPVALEVALFLHSPAFKSGVFGFSAAGRVSKALVKIGSVEFNLVYFILFVTSLIAFLLPVLGKTLKDFRTALKVTAFSCFAIFACFEWHPQWILFLTPFITLLIVTSDKTERLLWVDLILSAAFISFTIHHFPNNVDQKLWAFGVFRDLNSMGWDRTYEMRHLFFFRGLNGEASLALFNAALAMIWAGNHFKFGPTDQGTTQEISTPAALVRTGRYRTFVGLAIYILPAILAFYLTLRIHG